MLGTGRDDRMERGLPPNCTDYIKGVPSRWLQPGPGHMLVTCLPVQEVSCNSQPGSLHLGVQVCVVRTSRKTTGCRIGKVIRGTGDTKVSERNSLLRSDTGARRLPRVYLKIFLVETTGSRNSKR